MQNLINTHPIQQFINDNAKVHDVKSVAELAECRPVQIYRIIAGTRYPSRELAARLEKKTNGKIQASKLLAWNIIEGGEACN